MADSCFYRLAMGIDGALKGEASLGDISFCRAAVAFVLAESVDAQIDNADQFTDYLSRIDCSVSLKAKLMERKSLLWRAYSQLSGKYAADDCRMAVRAAAGGYDIDHLNIPDSLARLAVKLLSFAPGGNMADIACGRGMFLETALRDDEDLHGEGIDLSRENIDFAEMLTAAYSARATVHCASAFAYLGEHMWKYDKVFCFPPFGLKLDREYRWDEFQRMLPGAFTDVGSGCRSELIFALTAMAAMKEEGRAIILLPEGTLFNQMSGAVAARKYIVESGCLESVISLPPRLLEKRQIPLSIFVLSQHANRNWIMFIDATGISETGRRFDTINDDGINKVVNAVYGFGGEDEWIEAHCRTVDVQAIRDNGYNLAVPKYVPNAATPRFDNAVSFGEVIKSIARGANIASKEMDDLATSGNGVCFYLTPSLINGGVISSSLPEMTSLPARHPNLEDGDIILTRTGLNAKTAVFEDIYSKPVVLSSNLLVCKLDKEKIDPWYLKAFLESKDGQAMIGEIAIGATIKSISVASLEKMPVPLPTLSVQRRIGAAYREKFKRLKALRSELEKLEAEMTRVFQRKEA